MKLYAEKLMKRMFNYAPSFSYGVKVLKPGEFEAWINYKPPYNKNGGSWCAFNSSQEGAVNQLFEKMNQWRKDNKI